MKQPFVILLLFITVVSVSCSTKNSERGLSFETQSTAKAAGDQNSTSAPSKKLESIERKLIKEGRIEFETDNIELTQQKILKTIETYDGYIASDEINKWEGRKSNTLVIKVPAKHFDQLINEVTAAVEQLQHKQIQVQDVTEEFVDIEARLKTQKELEGRYLELLQKAKTVTEMLEIEKQIGKLRSEIESIEGRLQYLQNQTAYATLSLTFFEKVAFDNKFAQHFKNGFRNGWENLVWFIVAIINIWPFLLIGIALFWALQRYRKIYKTKSNKIKA